QICSLASGRLVHSIVVPHGPNKSAWSADRNAAAWSPDGRSFAAVSNDGKLLIYELVPFSADNFRILDARIQRTYDDTLGISFFRARRPAPSAPRNLEKNRVGPPDLGTSRFRLIHGSSIAFRSQLRIKSYDTKVAKL